MLEPLQSLVGALVAQTLVQPGGPFRAYGLGP